MEEGSYIGRDEYEIWLHFGGFLTLNRTFYLNITITLDIKLIDQAHTISQTIVTEMSHTNKGPQS